MLASSVILDAGSSSGTGSGSKMNNFDENSRYLMGEENHDELYRLSKIETQNCQIITFLFKVSANSYSQ